MTSGTQLKKADLEKQIYDHSIAHPEMEHDETMSKISKARQGTSTSSRVTRSQTPDKVEPGVAGPSRRLKIDKEMAGKEHAKVSRVTFIYKNGTHANANTGPNQTRLIWRWPLSSCSHSSEK